MKGPTVVGTFLAIAGITHAGSPGCGKPLPTNQPAGGSYKTDFTTKDGTPRSYIIHTPSKYDINKAAPVIFSFHGRGKTDKSQEALSQFSNEKWNPHAIAIYPQGLKDEWQGDPASKGVNDVAFTMELLDHLEDRYCVDSSRIYAAGKSNGGGFTNVLACDETASKRIAAFAPVSGAFYQNVSEAECNADTVKITCTPGRRNVPVLEFHGTADNVIPYEGGPRRGECLPSIPHFVREWVKRDKLGPTNVTRETFDGNVTEYQYGMYGRELGIVTHYRIQGLNHSWPSTTPNSDNPVGTYVNATPIIMKWFERWTV